MFRPRDIAHRLLSRHPRFGREITDIGGIYASSGSRVEPLVRRAMGEVPQKLKAVHCTSSKFLHFPGGIVEIQHIPGRC